MKRFGFFQVPVCLFVLLIAPTNAFAQVALGTGFSYQGRLAEGGSPANGVYDFEFALFDALAGGAQVANTVQRDDVSVSSGLFTTELDFGASAFSGDERWLEIRVRSGAETGAYTTLAPRSRIAPAPYAIHAQTSESASKLTRSFVVGEEQFVSDGAVVSFFRNTVEIRPGYGLDLSDIGQAVPFNAGPTADIAIAALSADRFVIAYRDGDGTGKAVIGTIANGSVTFSAESDFGQSGQVVAVGLCALTDSTVVVTYSTSSGGDNGIARLGTLGSNTISWGNPSLPFGTTTSFNRCIRLSDTTFAVVFEQGFGPSFGAARVGMVTDFILGTIVFSGQEVFEGSDIDFLSATPLNESSFLIAYQDVTNSSDGVVQFAFHDAFANTISYLATQTFTTGEAFDVSIAAFPGARFAIAYADGALANRGQIVGGQLTSPDMVTIVIEVGSPAEFNADSVSFTSMMALSPADYYMAYRNGGEMFTGWGASAEVRGTTAIAGSEDQFTDLVVNNIATARLSPLAGVIGFQRDQFAFEDGYVVPLRFESTPIIGIARAEATAGQSVEVDLLVPGGITDRFNGLIPGTTYYAQSDGQISSSSSAGPRIGVAISGTEILFTP